DELRGDRLAPEDHARDGDRDEHQRGEREQHVVRERRRELERADLVEVRDRRPQDGDPGAQPRRGRDEGGAQDVFLCGQRRVGGAGAGGTDGSHRRSAVRRPGAPATSSVPPSPASRSPAASSATFASGATRASPPSARSDGATYEGDASSAPSRPSSIATPSA